MEAMLENMLICSLMSSFFGVAAIIIVRFAKNISEKNKSSLLFWSQASPLAAMLIYPIAAFFIGRFDFTGISQNIVSPTFIDIIFFLWLIIALILIIKLLTEYIIFLRALRRSRKLLYEKGKVKVYKVNITGTSFVAGIVIPSVYISEDALSEYCDSEIELMSAHETAHLRNCDLHKKLILSLFECVNWFNPVYHLIKKHIILRMEYACDEAVAKQLCFEDRKKYALVLLKSAESGSLVSVLPTAGFSVEAENLQMRIKAFMKHNNQISGSRIAVKIIIIAMFILSLSVCAFAISSSSFSENVKTKDRLIYSESNNENIYQRGDGSLYSVIHGHHNELKGYYVDKYGYLGYDDPITGDRVYVVSLDWNILTKSSDIGASSDITQAVKLKLSDEVIVSDPSPTLVLDGELICTQADGVEFYRKDNNSIYFIIDGKATTVSSNFEEMYFIDNEGYISSFSFSANKKVYLKEIRNTEPGWFSAESTINKQEAIKVNFDINEDNSQQSAEGVK